MSVSCSYRCDEQVSAVSIYLSIGLPADYDISTIISLVSCTSPQQFISKESVVVGDHVIKIVYPSLGSY